ncbi:hypothetical protein AC244_18310 [Ensifer adhaerens]|uniref:Uncharacterized protein n=1 Tax=Ensifer adhaerens TaxID=106592 RepID=A0A0L8BRK1_ENSAD|nr:hypothetical protein AC244_18310 [Ensifer adhaerens]
MLARDAQNRLIKFNAVICGRADDAEFYVTCEHGHEGIVAKHREMLPRESRQMQKQERHMTIQKAATSAATALPTRRLGRTDMEITGVGFGAWAIRRALFQRILELLAQDFDRTGEFPPLGIRQVFKAGVHHRQKATFASQAASPRS